MYSIGFSLFDYFQSPPYPLYYLFVFCFHIDCFEYVLQFIILFLIQFHHLLQSVSLNFSGIVVQNIHLICRIQYRNLFTSIDSGIIQSDFLDLDLTRKIEIRIALRNREVGNHSSIHIHLVRIRKGGKEKKNDCEELLHFVYFLLSFEVLRSLISFPSMYKL